jgi:glycosyltransferase involved in cell wall biosynthesis
MTIDFTIIVAVYNEVAHIRDCLTSCLEQEYAKERYEIIMVDGLSTDGTREVAEAMQLHHDNLIVLANPNRTVPYALNIALAHARGRFILRVDGHSGIEKDYLRQCARFLETTRAECVGGAIKSINRTFMGRAIAQAMSCSFGVGNARFRTSGEPGYVDSLAFGAYRREIFDRIGGFDEAFTRCQDDEFNYRLRGAGGKIYFTPEIRAYYYPRSSLRKLWRQYYQYGYYKVLVLKRHLPRMQMRQFVPPAFVLSLIVAGILALSTGWGWLALAGILIPYLVLSLTSAVRIALRSEMAFLPVLPLIFLILHLSYGSGFLLGLLRFVVAARMQKKG